MTMDASEWVTFTGHLNKVISRDAGAAATLRRGLGRHPATLHAAHGIVIPHLPDNATATDREVAIVIAAYMATGRKQPSERKLSMGGAIRRIDGKRRGTTGNTTPSTLEKRLLAIGRERDLNRVLTVHMPGLISRVAAEHGTNPDWAALAYELTRWAKGRDRSVTTWLTDYHRTPTKTGTTRKTGSTPTPDTLASDLAEVS